MKQEFQVMLREEITKQQSLRTNYKKSVKFFMAISEKPDDITFKTLNHYRTKLRNVEGKLKKLRELQKSLSSVTGFICTGTLYDSQMKMAERWM